jgi:hypothetical protein
MTLLKRLQRIETSLTPREAVLLWLKGMLELSHESYLEKVFADPRNPRLLLLKAVAEAVRENLTGPPLKPELLEHAVREAQKQADVLITLILDLHDRVRSECRLNHPYAELLFERFQRMLLEQIVQHDRSQPDAWDSWRKLLTERLSAMWQLRKTVVAINARFFDGHPLLFAADKDMLNCQIVLLEDLRKTYNGLEHDLPGWTALNIDAQSSSMREQVEAKVAQLVAMANAKTLKDFGEEEAARELMDSYAFRALRELKRLRSSSSREDTLTS